MAEEIDAQAFLEHFGVRGMHWGQRKAKPPLTRRQQLAKDRRNKALKTGLKDGAKAALVTTAISGAWTLSMIAQDNPQSLVRGAKFAGEKMRVPMKVASKAAKGAKLLFQKDMVVFSPGTFTPGSFRNAGPLAITKTASAVGRF